MMIAILRVDHHAPGNCSTPAEGHYNVNDNYDKDDNINNDDGHPHR